jgi:hypothetical protein
MIIHVEKAHEDTKVLNATEHEQFTKILNHFNSGVTPVLQKKATEGFKLESLDFKTMSKFNMTRTRAVNDSQQIEDNIPTFNVNDFYVYPKEDLVITEAREDLIRETLKKEEEVRHKIQLENQVLLQNRLLEMKPKGPINGNKVTFDCNGNVVAIGAVNTEKLPNDFLSSK